MSYRETREFRESEFYSLLCDYFRDWTESIWGETIAAGTCDFSTVWNSDALEEALKEIAEDSVDEEFGDDSDDQCDRVNAWVEGRLCDLPWVTITARAMEEAL